MWGVRQPGDSTHHGSQYVAAFDCLASPVISGVTSRCGVACSGRTGCLAREGACAEEPDMLLVVTEMAIHNRPFLAEY